MKKVAVINFSGNVGKSSIARYLLAPRMECDVINVESINDAGSDKKSIATVRGKEISALRDYLLKKDSLVVDIGASNVEDFVDGILEYQDGIDDFEYFVVPTVPAAKQQMDTVTTIRELIDMGVDQDRIILIFNQFDKRGGPIARQYKLVCDNVIQENLCKLNEDAIVPTHSFFEAFQNEPRSLDEVVHDDANYREMISETDDDSLKTEYVRKIGMKSLAMGITKELNQVYSAISSHA